jgi:hypothetical protein
MFLMVVQLFCVQIAETWHVLMFLCLHVLCSKYLVSYLDLVKLSSLQPTTMGMKTVNRIFIPPFTKLLTCFTMFLFEITIFILCET